MEMQTKYFTTSEAKKTLPLVKQIVKDILYKSRELRLLAEDLGKLAESDPNIIKMMGELKAYIKEIEELGCYYKDWSFSIGLVDFPSVIKGNEVFLCWRSDEEDISWYHTTDEGYQGRKPIPDDYL
jgi:hypothetical protein